MRYGSRIRALEGRLGLGECPACGSSQCVVVWVTDEHPDYHQPACALCGQEPLVVVWDMRGDNTLRRSERPAAVVSAPSSAAPEGGSATSTTQEVQR
jgi:hypothetical protein